MGLDSDTMIVVVDLVAILMTLPHMGSHMSDHPLFVYVKNNDAFL
jgi:hypothetical protein